jgi:membrane protein insertase Oxa1/YidC/SpoIIIJ
MKPKFKYDYDILASFNILIFLTGLVFIILKLFNYITWSWWWVTCPFWGGIIFIIAIIILIVIFLKQELG